MNTKALIILNFVGFAVCIPGVAQGSFISLALAILNGLLLVGNVMRLLNE